MEGKDGERLTLVKNHMKGRQREEGESNRHSAFDYSVFRCTWAGKNDKRHFYSKKGRNKGGRTDRMSCKTSPVKDNEEKRGLRERRMRGCNDRMQNPKLQPTRWGG